MSRNLSYFTIFLLNFTIFTNIFTADRTESTSPLKTTVTTPRRRSSAQAEHRRTMSMVEEELLAFRPVELPTYAAHDELDGLDESLLQLESSMQYPAIPEERKLSFLNLRSHETSSSTPCLPKKGKHSSVVSISQWSARSSDSLQEVTTPANTPVLYDQASSPIELTATQSLHTERSNNTMLRWTTGISAASACISFSSLAYMLKKQNLPYRENFGQIDSMQKRFYIPGSEAVAGMALSTIATYAATGVGTIFGLYWFTKIKNRVYEFIHFDCKRKKEKIIAEMNANDKKCADEVRDLKDTFKKTEERLNGIDERTQRQSERTDENFEALEKANTSKFQDVIKYLRTVQEHNKRQEEILRSHAHAINESTQGWHTGQQKLLASIKAVAEAMPTPQDTSANLAAAHVAAEIKQAEQNIHEISQMPKLDEQIATAESSTSDQLSEIGATGSRLRAVAEPKVTSGKCCGVC